MAEHHSGIWRVKIRDRKSAGEIGWVADFLLGATDETAVFRIIRAAYPNALEHHAKEVEIDAKAEFVEIPGLAEFMKHG